MKLLAAICLVLLTFSATHVQGQAANDAAIETGSFEQAWRVGTGKQRSFFRFSTSMGKYVIRHDGLGEVGSSRIGTLFHLKLGMSGRIERVFFYEYQGDLLLLYEVSDGRAALGYLVRLDQQTRKTRWLTPVRGYNIGPSLVEGDAAYFAAVNVRAKVNLRTGAYLWKNESDTSIEEFQLPVIKGDVVIFAERAGNQRSIEVNKVDGTVRRINDGH